MMVEVNSLVRRIGTPYSCAAARHSGNSVDVARDAAAPGCAVSNSRSKQAAPLLRLDSLFNIAGLDLAHDLDAVGVEIIKKAGKLQDRDGLRRPW